MKRKVGTRRTGEKSRKCTTSTLQELSLRKSFFFEKKHESHQGKEPSLFRACAVFHPTKVFPACYFALHDSLRDTRPSSRGISDLSKEDSERTGQACKAVSVKYASRCATPGIWDNALQAPSWDSAPVWIHGDLSPLNMLVESGRVSAVIDFGCLGIGDPACDLLIAWNLFYAQTRKIFRSVLQVDDAMWARGRDWALSVALIALPYYQNTNPVLASISQRTINEVFVDYKHVK